MVPQEYREFVPERHLEKTYFLDLTTFNSNSKLFYLYTDIMRWKLRERSKSFIYREMRASPSLASSIRAILKKRRHLKQLNGDRKAKVSPSSSEFGSLNARPTRTPPDFFFRKIVRFKINLLKMVTHHVYLSLRRYTIRFLALGWLTRVVYKLNIAKIKPPRELRDLLSAKKFDLVILPSAAFEPIAINTMLSLKGTDTRCLMLVDNWDNLSSKTVLWELPNYIATWGRQSSQHAIEIQGMSPERVFEIGTARFSGHSDERAKNATQHFGHEYVLFVGTFLEYEEYKCLEILNDEIVANPKTYGDLRIIYRPHPYALQRLMPNLNNLSRVTLDSEILKQVQSSSTMMLDYEASLHLQLGAKFIAGGLTSMLIEASLLGKNFLSLVHHEKNNLTSPSTVFRSYKHFEGIEKLPNVYFSEDSSKLARDFQYVYNQPDLDQRGIDKELSYFYHLSDSGYSQDLESLVDKLLSGTKRNLKD